MSSTAYTEKCRANTRQSSVVKDEQTKSTTHTRRTAKTKEAAFTENVLRSSTEKDVEVKASTNTQRKLTVKHEEAKGKPIIHRHFTAKEEEHKHTSHFRQPSTAKDKESKTTPKVRVSVTAKDEEAKFKAKSRPYLTTLEERVKITPTPRRPLPAKDKETDYAASDRPSLTAEKEIVKSMSYISGQVTSKDKESKNTTHICEPEVLNDKKIEYTTHTRVPVTSKVKKPSLELLEPAISTDKKGINTENNRRPVTVNDEKAKRTASVKDPLKLKDQETINKANIRLTSKAEDVKAKTVTDMRQSLTVKDKEVKSTSPALGPLTTKYKGSQKTGNISGQVTSPQSTVYIRGPRTSKDKESKTKTHIHRPVTSEDKECKTTTYTHRPVTSEDKECKTTPHTRRLVTSEDKECKTTTRTRRPVTSEDKECKTTTHTRRPVTSGDKESKTKTHIRRLVTSEDKECKTTTHIRRPVTSEDKECKTTTYFHRPVTLIDKECKTTTYFHRPVTSEDKESKTTAYFQRPVTLIDKECKTTTHIHRPMTSEDKESETTTHIRRPVTSEDKESETTTHIRRPVTSEDKESETTTPVRRPVTSADKESKTTTPVRRQVTSEDKESKTTTHIRRPVTLEDKKCKTTAHVRRPVTSEDKESKLSTHIHRPVTSEDKESKNETNIWRPFTGTDYEAKYMPIIHIQDKSKDKGSKNTTTIRQPLMSRDKECTKRNRDPVALKYDRAKNKANVIKKPMATKDEETEISSHARESNNQEDNISKIRRPLMAKDRDNKSVAHTRKPLTTRNIEDKISKHTNGQISSNDQDAKMLAQVGPVLIKDKEGKSTADINQTLATDDNEVEYEVNKQIHCHVRSTKTDNEPTHSHKISDACVQNANGFNLKRFAKNGDNAKTKFSQSIDLLEDEETLEISKDVSKTDPDDLQFAESSVKIPSQRESIKRDKFNLDDNKTLVNLFSESNKGDRDIPRKGKDTESTTYSRRPLAENETSDATKMHKAISVNASSEHKIVQIDGNIREQNVFLECTSGAGCLNKQSRRHEQDEKYFNHSKTQNGNEGSLNAEAVQPTKHSDRRGEAIHIENREIHTIKSTSDIQSKSTINNSMEINGCRPKQRSTVQKEYAKSQTFTRKRQEDVHFVFKVTEISFLKNMMDEDSNVIVSELTRSPSLLKNCIEKTATDETIMALFLQVLAKAYLPTSALQSMIPLFETLKVTGFFEILVEYLARIIIQIKSKQRDGYTYELVLKQILSITIAQITRNPSSLVVFRILHALMGQVIDDLVENGTIDDHIITEYQRLTEHKKVIEREGRQATEPKQYCKPPDDFREYSISPTADEITGKVKPFLRPNTIDGGYEDLNDYLDVQFRLLREDFVGPLREGMTGYINIMTSHKGYKNANEKLKDLDIKVYENVRVHAPVVTQQGLCYKLKLQMTANLRRTEWKFSKRLIYGSMVCLTDKDFKNFFLATVVEREERDIKHGFFTVHFEREDVSTKDLLNNVFRMAETTGYFEAYRHVLSSLQTFRNGDLPFEKYIVNCEKKVGLPAYLASYLTYDLRPLVDQNVELKASRRLGDNALTHERPTTDFSQRSSIARSIQVTDHKSWPSRELLQMDESQYRAVQTALTNELAIIQGPPGTGKTYIGLQIVKALLHNKPAWAGTGRYNRPMLIVCYTNHALDQFLEGIVKYFKGDVLRVGGRSSSTDLEQFNLKTYRQMCFEKGTTLASLQFNKRSARRNMERQSRCVQKLAKTIQVYRTEILTEEVLSMEMGETLHESLEKGYRGKVNKDNFSYIVKWLGIAYLKRECQKEIQNPQKAKKTKHVRVEDEIARIQKERKIDIEETLHFSAKEMSLLWEIRKTDVAFFVEDIKLTRRKKGKNSDIGTPQDKMFLKLFKSIIVGKITDEDIMSQEEADNIKDIWRLNHKTKWRLYRLWIQNLCANLYEQMEANRRDFEAASERYRDALADVDKGIMRQAAVIGMTTSGAARYQSVLRDIGPRIIVVEEAAEVLEAHIITTLSKGCEHLILIGDHKQLRPNPTVYKLAVKYNLDVSLFERMVKNDMPFNCLELQHRMRPEISSIMRHIYPDLKDHEHVKTYPNVKGISTNLFLINHTHLESCNEDIKSYVNTKEAEYAVALCRYLLLQGYERHDITVLTTYTGQLMYMRNLMPEEEFDGVKVTVVDNYQGEENEIVLLSLVRSNMIDKIGFLKIENRICVALSRAKIGFFVIGNFGHLANHSVLWKNITTEAKAKNCFGNGLVLYCQNHPRDNAIVAKDSEDFKRAPEGGCIKKCDVRLECGHKCERHCHVLDKEHVTNKCQKPCTKVLCEVGHICPDKCFIECNPCSVMLRKTIPKCSHVQIVPCATEPEDFCCMEPCEEKLECNHPCKNVCGEAHTSRCLEKIPFTWPCGHKSTISCWEAKLKPCPHPCGTELQCNHICSGTCGTCFMGRIHLPCIVKCNVQHLCGHKLSAGCQDYRVCVKPCENRCSHGKCTKRCGELCSPCKKPCSRKCPHKTCTKGCDEPCDRVWCNISCQKMLKCQHKCIGLCGEPCPSICRLCHRKVFKENTFGTKHKQDARYILLEACGHLVEYRFMDAYMLKHETVSNVRLLCCPKCKTPIRYCPRYGNIIKVALKDIERAKRGIIGNISMYDTLQHSVIRLTAGNLNDLKIYSYMTAGILSPEEARTKYPSHWRRSICKQKLRERLTHLKANGLYTERQLVTVQKQYETANEIIDLTKRITDCEEHSETENSLVLFLHEMLLIVLQPRDNLTKQEDGDFRQEIKRGEAFVKFLKTKKLLQSATGAEEAYTDLQNIESVVLDETKFTQEKESEINGRFERLNELLRTECLQIIDIEHGTSVPVCLK